MQIGTRVRCIQAIPMNGIELGTTGVYSRGEDYVPGWDAGIFEVTLDTPVRRPCAPNNGPMLAQPHWTLEELLRYWQPL